MMIGAAMLHGQYGIWDELIPSLVVLVIISGFLYLNFRLAYKNDDTNAENVT